MTSAKAEVDKAKQKLVKKDGEIIVDFINEVGHLLPAFAGKLTSNDTGYKVVFNFYKTDNGQHSVQLLRNGKARRNITDHALAQMSRDKEYRDEKLQKRLKEEGIFCETKTQMMGEILRLKNVIKKMENSAKAEKQVEEME